MRPELSLGLSLSVLDSAVETRISRGINNEVRSVFSVLVGLRSDFLSSAEHPRWRPYLTAALGPYFGSVVESRASGFGSVDRTRTLAAFGGRLGGGLDVQLSRLMMLGGRAGYNFTTDFSSPVGGEVNYSGFCYKRVSA